MKREIIGRSNLVNLIPEVESIGALPLFLSNCCKQSPVPPVARRSSMIAYLLYLL